MDDEWIHVKEDAWRIMKTDADEEEAEEEEKKTNRAKRMAVSSK